MSTEPNDRTAGKIEIGRLSLDLHRAVLQLDGETVSLRPQSFEVLRILAENPGSMVDKRVLIDKVWGDVAVTDDSLTQCLADIRRALSDTDKKIVRTIPRRGFVLEGDLLAPDGDPESDDRAPHRYARAAVVAAVVFGAIAFWQFVSTPVRDDGPAQASSIAVLPFADMTAAQDQRHLAEGIAEEVSNLLTSSSNLKVIARTSTFSIARSGADIETISERLGVSHVLEGSVRQGDDRLRISVQLIDADTSMPVWSETYDQPLGNILELQTEIARSVAGELHVELAPASDDLRDQDPYAHSLIIQARNYNLMIAPERRGNVAEVLLQEALELDPDNVRVYTELARTALFRRDPEGSENRYAEWQRSMELTDQALELDPRDPVANAFKGWHEMSYFANYADAATYLERAMAADPRNSDVLSVVMNACLFFGRYDLGIELGRYIVERDPLCVNCALRLSQNATLVGEFELAESALLQLMRVVPEDIKPDINRQLADIRLMQGNPQGALELLDQDEEMSPLHLSLAAIANYQLDRMEAFGRYRRDLIERYGDTQPEVVASVEAATGDVESAFTWLEKNLQQSTQERGLNVGLPYFDILQGDPRWMDYLRALNMAPEQRAAIEFNPRLPF